MKVQLVCRSDKEQKLKEALEVPFEYDDFGRNVILVPDLESYNQVKGELFILNLEAEVICLLPPATYTPHVSNVPYVLVHKDFTVHADPLEDGMQLKYYFKPLVDKELIYD